METSHRQAATGVERPAQAASASVTVADLSARSPTPAHHQTNDKKRQRAPSNALDSTTSSGDSQHPPHSQQKHHRRRGSGSRKPEVIVISGEDKPAAPAVPGRAPASSRPAEPAATGVASTRNARPDARVEMAQLEPSEYFTVLGLSRAATDADVRKAYRKLAVRWHPDKNHKNPRAEEYFKRIAEAYEVLSDPEKRRQYERSSTQGGGGNAFSGIAFHSAGISSRHARDIFESFFGAAHDPFDTPFFRGAEVSGLAGRRQPATDPFDDFDSAFRVQFTVPPVGSGNRGRARSRTFRHKIRGANGLVTSVVVASGNIINFSAQTVRSSSSTDRHGRVVATKTKTTVTMTPDGEAETVTETFRDGERVSSTTSVSV